MLFCRSRKCRITLLVHPMVEWLFITFLVSLLSTRRSLLSRRWVYSSLIRPYTLIDLDELSLFRASGWLLEIPWSATKGHLMSITLNLGHWASGVGKILNGWAYQIDLLQVLVLMIQYISPTKLVRVEFALTSSSPSTSSHFLHLFLYWLKSVCTQLLGREKPR